MSTTGIRPPPVDIIADTDLPIAECQRIKAFAERQIAKLTSDSPA